ncbi:MAG: twin-arginine translocase subunit TatC [Phycisphaerae bacterium]
MSRESPPTPPESMTLGEHLEELRRRLIYALLGLAVAFVAALAAGNYLVEAVKHPYVVAMRAMGHEPGLIVLHATEGFIIYMKVALLGGVILASPWIFYQLWMFVSAGLYDHERRMVLPAVALSAVLFLAGAAFFLLGISVPVLKFFLGFSGWLGLRPDITFSNHVSMMLSLMLVFGLAFQTPLVVLILAKMGLVTRRQLAKYRRHVIIAMFILAAVATSPSPVDQVAMALPMWLLYELGVLLVRIFVRQERNEPSPTDNEEG